MEFLTEIKECISVNQTSEATPSTDDGQIIQFIEDVLKWANEKSLKKVNDHILETVFGTCQPYCEEILLCICLGTSVC